MSGPKVLRVTLRSRLDGDPSITKTIRDMGSAGLDDENEAVIIRHLVPAGKSVANYDVYINEQDVTKQVNMLLGNSYSANALGKGIFGQSQGGFSYNVRKLSDPDPKNRAQAVLQLAHYAEAEKFLFDVLRDNSEADQVREHAIDSLQNLYQTGQLKDKNQAVSSFINILDVTSAGIQLRLSATEALGCIRHSKALAPLMRTLENGETSELRIAAVVSLGQLSKHLSVGKVGENQILQSLVNVLYDADIEVQLVAIDTLDLYFKLEPITELLIKIINDPTAEIRPEAALALLKVDLNSFLRHQDFNLSQWMDLLFKDPQRPELRGEAIVRLAKWKRTQEGKLINRILKERYAQFPTVANYILELESQGLL